MNKIFERRGIRQFVKFGIIGTSGAVVDFGMLNLLAVGLHQNVYLSAAISFILAATNNFIWNKKWTFRGLASEKKLHLQYAQYVFVAGIGFFLNLLILRIFLPYFGDVFHLDMNRALVINSSKIVATLMVMLWNFFGSKKLVFNEHR